MIYLDNKSSLQKNRILCRILLLFHCLTGHTLRGIGSILRQHMGMQPIRQFRRRWILRFKDNFKNNTLQSMLFVIIYKRTQQ